MKNSSTHCSIEVKYQQTVVGKPPWSLKNDNGNLTEKICDAGPAWELKLQYISFFLLVGVASLRGAVQGN